MTALSGVHKAPSSAQVLPKWRIAQTRQDRAGRPSARAGQARGQDERPSDSSIQERPSTAREASNRRPGGLGEDLKGSLEGQVESKLRLEASLKGQVAPKKRQAALGVRLGVPSCAWRAL